MKKHKLALVMSGISGRIYSLRIQEREGTNLVFQAYAQSTIKHLEEILAELQEVLDE